MNQTAEHPPAERLSAFLLGKLDGPASREIEDHLEVCDDCCGRLDAIEQASEADELIDHLRQPQNPVPDTRIVRPPVSERPPTREPTPKPPEAAGNVELLPARAAHVEGPGAVRTGWLRWGTPRVVVLAAVLAVGGIAWTTADDRRREAGDRRAAQRQLADALEATFQERLTAGDLFAALAVLNRADEAARLGLDDDPAALAAHDDLYRRRAAALLDRLPRLRQVWACPTAPAGVQFDAAGRRVLVTPVRGPARVWDADTGEPAGPPLGDANTVAPVARLTPDGRFVVAAGPDGVVRCWDVTAGRLATPELRADFPVTRLDLTPLGDCVAAFGPLPGPVPRYRAQVWTLPDGQSRATHDAAAPFTPGFFTADGRQVVTRATGGVEWWDADAGQVTLSRPLSDGGGVLGASPDRRSMAVLTNNALEVWTTADGKRVARPYLSVGAGAEVSEGQPLAAAFDPHGRFLAVGTQAGKLVVWDCTTLHRSEWALPGEVAAVALSSDGRFVAAAGQDGTARVFRVSSGGPAAPPLPHDGGVTHVAFHPTRNLLLTAATDGTARLWDLGDAAGDPGRSPHVVVPHPGGRAATFSPDGHTLATAGTDGHLRFWAADDLRPVGEPLAVGDRVEHLGYLAGGGRVVVGSAVATAVWDVVARGVLRRHVHDRDGTLVVDPAGAWYARYSSVQRSPGFELWDATSGRRLGDELAIGSYPLTVTPSASRLAVGQPDDRVGVLDTRSGSVVGSVPADGVPVLAAFRPDGRHLLTLSRPGVAQVWDGESFRELARSEAPGAADAAYHPDGSRAVIGFRNGYARVFDPAAPQSLGPPMRHGAAVRFVRYSPPSGDWLLTVGEDHAARLWNAATGQPVSPPWPHPAAVREARFSPAGRRVLVVCDDGSIHLWRVPVPTQVPADALRALAGLFPGSAGGPSHPRDGEAIRAVWEGLRRDYPDLMSPAPRE